VLEVARRRFLADGYQAVTMRSIAAEAGVDAALISYFFGSKQGLFAAALTLAANPAKVLGAALPGDPETLPERLLRARVTTWDDEDAGAPLRVMVRAAAADPGVGRLVREFVQREMVDRIAERLGGRDARQRAGVLGIQLSGVIFSRYVLAVEPAATMPVDELVRLLAPALRTTLRPGGRAPSYAAARRAGLP
jgi:AcrR family transcriptional regulator